MAAARATVMVVRWVAAMEAAERVAGMVVERVAEGMVVAMAAGVTGLAAAWEAVQWAVEAMAVVAKEAVLAEERVLLIRRPESRR